jgi:O-antigen ligase
VAGAAGLGTASVEAGLIVVALLAAAAHLAPSTRGRALSMAGALTLSPVLLIAHMWDGPQVQAVGERPAMAGAGAALGLVAMSGLAWLFLRRPGALALAAVTLMPFRLPIPIGATTANLLVPLYLVIGSGALAYIVSCLRGGRKSEGRRPGAAEWLLLGFVVLYAAQATYSSDFDRALQNTVLFYVPFAVLYALFARVSWTPELLRACLAVLVALAGVFCAVGFAQYATGTLLLNPKLMASNEYDPYFRANSLFFDPNIYGRFLVVVMLGVAAIVAWRSRTRDVLASAAVLAVLWCGLLTTLSRSSFGALLVGIAVLVALRGKTRVVATVMGSTVALGAAVMLAAAPDRGEGSSLRKSTSGRSDLMRGGGELFAQRPLAGWGSGAFAVEYRRQGKGPSEEAVSASHTIPLTVAVEQGLTGLGLYVALLLAAGRAVSRRAQDSPSRAALTAVFAALVFHSLLYAAFLEEPLVWALLGSAVALDGVRRHAGPSARASALT